MTETWIRLYGKARCLYKIVIFDLEAAQVLHYKYCTLQVYDYVRLLCSLVRLTWVSFTKVIVTCNSQ